MRNFLLVIFISFFTISAYAQIRKYPPLIREDVDFKALEEKCSKSPLYEGFLCYKLVTTKPVTVRSVIEDRYIMSNNEWKKLGRSKHSENVLKLSEALCDTVQMRSPLPDEPQNYIYFEANISDDSLSSLLVGTVSSDIKPRKTEGYDTKPFANLDNLAFYIHPDLHNRKKEPIGLGEKCIVTVENYNDSNKIKVIIAVEISTPFYDLGVGSRIELSATRILTPSFVTITKNDVGKPILRGSLFFTLSAFEDGIVHLICHKASSKDISELTLIGDIDNNKFQIGNTSNSVSFVVYDRYRAKAGFTYDEFEKDANKNKRRIHLDINDLNQNVELYNIGYAIDSLHIFSQPTGSSPTMFRYVAAISNDDPSGYAFRTILKGKKAIIAQGDDLKMGKYVQKIKNYISSHVKYPIEAERQKLTEVVVLGFVITSEGKITDIEFTGSPHPLFKNEILRVIKFAPNFPRVDDDKDYNTRASMNVLFHM